MLMAATPPLIGLTTVRMKGKDGRMRDALTQDYAAAILQAGGVPVLVPLSTLEADDERFLRALYDRVDGIVLPGGGDIHPDTYGEHVSDTMRGISRLRDHVDPDARSLYPALHDPAGRAPSRRRVRTVRGQERA